MQAFPEACECAGDRCATATVAARWHAVYASEQTAFGGGDILVAGPPISVFALAHARGTRVRAREVEAVNKRSKVISLDTILLIVLVLLLVGVLLPAWPHARG